MSRKRKKKNRFWLINIGLLIAVTMIFSSLLVRDDTNAYGRGRKAIFKNPINPDCESNDNGVITSFKIKALNIVSGEEEFGSNAMSIITADEEEASISTVKNYADIIDLDIYSNLCLTGNIKNTSDTDRKVSFSVRLPAKAEIKASAINFINSDIKIFTGDLSGVNITYVSDGEAVSESAGRNADLKALKEINFDGVVMPLQEVEFSIPMEITEFDSEESTEPGKIDRLFEISEKPENNVFTFDIACRYPVAKILNISLATCHGSERVEDFTAGKVVGAVRRDGDSFDMLPADIIEKFPDADSACISMFIKPVKGKNDEFVNDYSQIEVETKDLQRLVNESGYSLTAVDNSLPQSILYTAGDTAHIYDEDGLELNLGKKDKHGILLSKVYVEFQRVLECRDMEIPVTADWDKFDNLVSAKVIKDGRAVDIDRAVIRVETDIAVHTVGEYIVKYSCEVIPDEWVSSTAKVKIVDKSESMSDAGEDESGTDTGIRLDR